MAINPMATMLSGTNQTMSQTSRPNNPMAMLAEFAKFKKQMAGKDPKSMVQELLDSGKMSKEQFESLKEQASALSSILK